MSGSMMDRRTALKWGAALFGAAVFGYELRGLKPSPQETAADPGATTAAEGIGPVLDYVAYLEGTQFIEMAREMHKQKSRATGSPKIMVVASDPETPVHGGLKLSQTIKRSRNYTERKSILSGFGVDGACCYDVAAKDEEPCKITDIPSRDTGCLPSTRKIEVPFVALVIGSFSWDIHALRGAHVVPQPGGAERLIAGGELSFRIKEIKYQSNPPAGALETRGKVLSFIHGLNFHPRFESGKFDPEWLR